MELSPTGFFDPRRPLKVCTSLETKHPSTRVKLTLNFLSCGPKIDGTIDGQQTHGTGFLPHEFELPIAMDLDSQMVAIYDEGRSFSPHEVANDLTQYFHWAGAAHHISVTQRSMG
jgi:hypothetical protein